MNGKLVSLDLRDLGYFKNGTVHQSHPFYSQDFFGKETYNWKTSIGSCTLFSQLNSLFMGDSVLAAQFRFDVLPQKH